MTYFGILLSLLIPVVFVQLKWAYRRRQVLRMSWQGILGRAETINLDGIRDIAELSLQSSVSVNDPSANDPWKTLGGFKGTNLLRRNAKVMLDLCVFAERFNHPETTAAMELIRHDAVILNHSVTRIQLEYILGFGFLRSASRVEVAAVSYYLLRSRVIGLYQASQMSLVPQLEAAV